MVRSERRIWRLIASAQFFTDLQPDTHGVIEFARNVLGRGDATHAEYGVDGELFIDELLCSLVGQVMAVELVDAGFGELHERGAGGAVGGREELASDAQVAEAHHGGAG